MDVLAMSTLFSCLPKREFCPGKFSNAESEPALILKCSELHLLHEGREAFMPLNVNGNVLRGRFCRKQGFVWSLLILSASPAAVC